MQTGRVAAEVLGDHADLLRRHVQLVLAGVLEDEVVALRSRQRAVDHASVSGDAVDTVDGEVPRLQLVGDRAGRRRLAKRGAVRVCRREPKRSSSVTTASRRASKTKPAVERGLDALDRKIAQDLGGALERAVAAADEHDPRAVGRIALESARELGGVALGRCPTPRCRGRSPR